MGNGVCAYFLGVVDNSHSLEYALGRHADRVCAVAEHVSGYHVLYGAVVVFPGDVEVAWEAAPRARARFSMLASSSGPKPPGVWLWQCELRNRRSSERYLAAKDVSRPPLNASTTFFLLFIIVYELLFEVKE